MVNRKTEVLLSLNPSISFTEAYFTETSVREMVFIRNLSGHVPNTYTLMSTFDYL